MSTQLICDNCKAVIPSVRFQLSDGFSGEEWDTCSAECATALVVRAVTMDTEMDRALDELGEVDDSDVDAVVEGVRERFASIPPQIPNLSDAVHQLVGAGAFR